MAYVEYPVYVFLKKRFWTRVIFRFFLIIHKGGDQCQIVALIFF